MKLNQAYLAAMAPQGMDRPAREPVGAAGIGRKQHGGCDATHPR